MGKTNIENISVCNSLFRMNLDQSKIMSLFDFYQYQMASSTGSPLSMKLDSILNDEQKNELLAKLFKVAEAKKEDFLFSKMLVNVNEQLKIDSLGLSDTSLRLDIVKGFFSQAKNEHEFDSLFRHIRNSFAHGLISLYGEYFLIEDKGPKMLTCRFVIKVNDLESWITIVNQYLPILDKNPNFHSGIGKAYN